MKKLILVTCLGLFVIACNTRKQVERSVSSGNYDQAIVTAINKLKVNKDKKRKGDYILMLKDAYNKANDRDLSKIRHLKKNNNPEEYNTIYKLYKGLNSRQESIKPILPLYVDGKKIPFNLADYSDNILESKNVLSDYLYEKGIALLESDDKSTIRKAHSTLKYLNRISPNYEQTQELIEEAHQRGINYIIVSINNQTQQVIPKLLEQDLLNFDTYGLNKFWSVYHANHNAKVSYDYAMQLNLKGINISPEKINTREVLREKRIKDGWEYKLDKRGNVVKDSLGNDIKVDKIINIKCRLYQTIQTKSSQIIAEVVYIDLKSNQILDKFPIDSGFIFENIFAKFRGDKRALNNNDRNLLNNRQVSFPTNEQIIYDTGEDLKLQLKDIINSYTIK